MAVSMQARIRRGGRERAMGGGVERERRKGAIERDTETPTAPGVALCL